MDACSLDSKWWMETFEIWWQLISGQIPRLAVVLIVFLSVIRLCFRHNLINFEHNPLSRRKSPILIGIIFLVTTASLSVLGNHLGDIVMPTVAPPCKYGVVNVPLFNANAIFPKTLADDAGIVGFRDTWIMVAGLIGGVEVGLPVGLIAGLDRFFVFRGEWAKVSMIACIAVGLCAGLFKKFHQKWTENVVSVFGIAIGLSILQRLILMTHKDFSETALAFALQISLPGLIINVVGCVVFLWIYQDIERDKSMLKAGNDAYYKINALRLMTKPHASLNTVFNRISYLIKDGKGLEAVDQLDKLGGYVSDVNDCAKKELIPLERELGLVKNCIDFHKLKIKHSFEANLPKDEELPTNWSVVPFCLMTLVENAFSHAFADRKDKNMKCKLDISAEEIDGILSLTVTDTGPGVPPDRIDGLFARPLKPEKPENSGKTLFSLAGNVDSVFRDGGSIEYDKTYKHGSRFIIKFSKKEV